MDKNENKGTNYAVEIWQRTLAQIIQIQAELINKINRAGVCLSLYNSIHFEMQSFNSNFGVVGAYLNLTNGKTQPPFFTEIFILKSFVQINVS